MNNFWPQNDDKTLYIESDSCSLNEVISQVKEKWPNANFSDFLVSAEHVHTHCLGYDLYDPDDWTNFTVIRKQK